MFTDIQEDPGMVYDDTFVQGMAYVVMIVFGMIIAIGGAEIPVLYSILRITKNRTLHLGILAVALLPGFFLSRTSSDDTGIAFVSLLLVGPIITLIPLYVYPPFFDPRSRFVRILIGYIVVSLFGIVLIFASTSSNLNIIAVILPQIYELAYPPLNLPLVCASVLIMETFFAFVIYGIMHLLGPAHPVKEENPV